MNPERKIHPSAVEEKSTGRELPSIGVLKDDLVLATGTDVAEELNLSGLVEMYRTADQTALLTVDAEGKQTFKKLGEVIREIEAVLLAQKGLNEKEVRDYLDRIVSRLRSEIQLTSQGIANEKQDEQKRLDLIQVRNKKYEELLESVAAFIETGKINKEQEQVIEDREFSAEVVEILDEKLISLKKKFTALKTLLKEKGGVFNESPACIGAKKIIDIIGSLKENDLTTRRNIERTYLRNLERALNNLREEIKLLPLKVSVSENNIEVAKDVEPIEMESESTMLDADTETATDIKPKYEIETGLKAEETVPEVEEESPLNFDLKRMRSQLERDTNLFAEHWAFFSGPTFITERKTLADYEKIKNNVTLLLDNGISDRNVGEYNKAKDEYEAVRRDVMQIIIENGLLLKPNTQHIKDEKLIEIEALQNAEPEVEEVSEEASDLGLTVEQFSSLLWGDDIQLFYDGRIKTGFDESTTNLLKEYSEKRDLLHVYINNNVSVQDERFLAAGAEYLRIHKILLSKGILNPKKEKVIDIEQFEVEAADTDIEGFIRRRKVDANGNTLPQEEEVDNKIDTVPEEMVNNRKERGEWLKAREIFKKTELEYNEAFALHYKNYHNDNSWRTKINKTVDSTKKIFGINSDLPLQLRLMKEDYKFARANYLVSLDGALKKRASMPGNNEYDLNADKSKIAFGIKFIINPSQERLNLQQQNALSPEEQGRLSTIMNSLSKYKWHTRVGSVALAGALGAASGGVGALAVGAGWQAWKIAASAVAGSTAAKMASKGMQKRVDTATDNIKTAAEMSARNFSLKELDNLEQELLMAYSAKDMAKKQQRAATIAAAVTSGLATGATLHSFGSELSELSKVNTVPEKPIDTAEFFSKDNLVVNNRYETTSNGPLIGKENLVNSAYGVPQNQLEEIPPLNALQLNPEIVITYYSLNGTPESQMVLSDIKIIGNFNNGFIPAADLEKMNETIALKANDLLSVHPNMSETVLEAEILSKLKEDFGETEWWKNSVTAETKIDIGKIIPPNRLVPDVYEPHIQNPVSTEAVEKVPVAGITPVHVYAVEKGDNMWDITKKEFSQELAGLDEAKQDAVLSKLMSIARVNEDVRNSLGLPSGDPELIYAGDKINLDSLGEELKRLVELQKVDYVPYTNSADLAIESDNGVHEVPIKVAEVVPEVTSVQAEIMPVKESIPVEAPVPSIEKIINPPRLFSATENYYDAPEYKQFVVQNFGDLKIFDKTVERAVINFDNNTYDILERSAFFGNDYQSPYNFMRDMSLKEIQEFNNQSPAEIKNILGNENIKYETFLAWNDEINKMESKLPYGPSTKLSDLFARYIAEQPIKGVDILTKTK